MFKIVAVLIAGTAFSLGIAKDVFACGGSSCSMSMSMPATSAPAPAMNHGGTSMSQSYSYSPAPNAMRYSAPSRGRSMMGGMGMRGMGMGGMRGYGNADAGAKMRGSYGR